MGIDAKQFQTATIQDIEKIYNMDYGRFLSFARSLSANKEEAEDIVHDVYLKLIKRDHLIKEKLRSYIFSSIRNEFITKKTRSRYEKESVLLSMLAPKKLEEIMGLQVSPNLSFIDEDEGREGHKMLEEAMQEMRPLVRETFIYRVIQELSPKEVANLTGETETCIKMRSHRGYSTLRRVLARHGIYWNSRAPHLINGKTKNKRNVA